MSLITIQKSELTQLENALKEKDRQIKKLQVDNGILVGINHHNSVLLLKTVLESGKTTRKMYALTPVLGRDANHLKQRDDTIALLDADIANQQKKLDIALSKARAFCQENADVVRALARQYHVDILALIAKVT
ncbi:MAG: hypothetical protein WCE46_02535 [Methanoregula sp.]|uniref:hypothetical protein n=1 Tax=Methanoregula sp. TaxID=2052170 RepID=UPI003C74EC9C